MSTENSMGLEDILTGVIDARDRLGHNKTLDAYTIQRAREAGLSDESIERLFTLSLSKDKKS